MRLVPHTPVRLGILGAAKIARLFTAAVRPSRKGVVAAVAARDEARARQFARDLGVPQVHASYDALLADPAIRRGRCARCWQRARSATCA